MPRELQPFLVTVPLRAPGEVVPATAADDLAGLLAVDGAGPWSTVRVATGTRGLELRVVAAGPDARTAGAATVDGLRALLGLDAGFARWVLDARRVQVRELPA